jgi:hypothetical protein
MSDDPVQTIPEGRGVVWLMRGWALVAAPYIIAIMATSIAMSHWFHLGCNPFVFFVTWLPAMAVDSVFRYRRYFHPERVPPALCAGSGELAGLKRRKTLLGWASFSCVVFCVVVIAIASFTGERKTVIDRTWYLLMLPALGICICVPWMWAVDAYIKCRTPVRMSAKGNFRRPPIPLGKPFQSDHWGEPPQRT